MTKKDQLDYLTVQVARLKNGAKLSKDSLDMMLWILEDMSAKEAKAINEPELFPVTKSILDKRPTLRETQARQAEARQGQL